MRNVLVVLLSVLALSASAKFRIAVFSDTHASPGNDNMACLARAVDEVNHGGVDVLVVNGDLSNEGSDHELQAIHEVLAAVKVPMHLIPGNHENNWSESATRTFPALWGSDRFAAVYDMDSSPLLITGVNCGPYMKMGDGHVKDEDLAWLDHAVDSLTREGTVYVSFCHYPLKEDDLDNWRDYVDILHRHGASFHVNGHYHRWALDDADGIPAVTVRALAVDDTRGYTLIDIDGGEAVVQEKLLGHEPTVLYRLPLRTVVASPANGRSEVRESIFTRLAFDGDNVYYGTSSGHAVALSKGTGEIAWRVDLGAPLFSRPVALDSARVAFPHADGIAVLASTDGAHIADLDAHGAPYVADGLVVGDRYLQGGADRMECFSTDGQLLWTLDSISRYCQGAPAVDGDDVVFGAWDTYLRCASLADGELRWRWSNGKPGRLLSPGNVVPVVTPDRVVIVSPDRYMTAIDRATGATLWRDNSLRYRESLGRSADGSLAYAKTMDGQLVAVDITGPDFREAWVCDMGIGYEHAPCIVAEADGVVYAGSRRGIVTAIDASSHSILWQRTLGHSEVNGIDIDPTDGSVWVSLVEGRVVSL